MEIAINFINLQESRLGVFHRFGNIMTTKSTNILHSVTRKPSLDGMRLHHTEEVNMKCKRCGGVMVFEKFYGICEEFFGWRCIFCGEIIDQVILENRIEQRR